MKQWLYTDNQLQQYDTDSSAPFIYQRMRTCGYAILHLESHIDIIQRATKTLFGKTLELNSDNIQDICKRILLRGNYPAAATHIVELRCTEHSQISMRIVETSIYNGYNMRVVRPKAHLMELSGEPLHIPTSGSLALLEVIRTIARADDGAVALCTDCAGNITAIDGASPIMVKGRKITISPTIESVETTLVTNALMAFRGENLSIGNITTAELATADELFYADSRGITSISQFENNFYSDGVAYAIAKQIK